ncbi:MAM and LDL-receptor class A domain-containing protein 2-like [Argonauta hians]
MERRLSVTPLCRGSVLLLVFAALILPGKTQYHGDMVQDYNYQFKVFYSNQWHYVCSNTDLPTRKVMCRSLGLEYSSYSTTYRSYSNGVQLHCRGHEKSILSCRISSYYCSYKLRLYCNQNPTDMFCSFDNDKCGMYQLNGTSQWKRIYPSNFFTGPSTDHTTRSSKGKYMLATAQGFSGSKVTLKTKNFYKYLRSVKFFYHMSGKDMGTLNVYTDRHYKTLVGSVSGDQGNKWNEICFPVNGVYGHEVVFEAVQGNGFESNIAIDDVTLSTHKCSYWNGSCDFNDGSCGYFIQKLNWYSNYGWFVQPSSGYVKSKGDSLVFKPYYYAMTKYSVISPLINLTNGKSKVEFYYYIPRNNYAALEMKFIEDGTNSRRPAMKYFWQDSEFHGNKWQYGCMNLPNKTGNLIISGYPKSRNYMYLDDIVTSNGTCPSGISDYTCTFDSKLMCDYSVNCMNLNEFTWRRNMGSTLSKGTGPNTDSSQDKSGFYMYAEASYGKPNDTAELSFPVTNPKVKSLKFAVNMYGKGIGQLFVTIKIPKSGEKIVWKKSGDQGIAWKKVCFNIYEEITAVTFTAVRGDSYLGDIAVDNVLADSNGCPGVFDCEFPKTSCSYSMFSNNLRYSIRTLNSYDSNADYFLHMYSTSYSENSKFQIESPKASVMENSSLTFRYRMGGSMKEMALYFHESDSMKTTASPQSSTLENLGVSTNSWYRRTIHSGESSWSSHRNDMSDFVTACVDLPVSDNLQLIFDVTSIGYGAFASLDDIHVNNGTCKLGLTHRVCRFQEVHLCDYYVECPSSSHYNWSRVPISGYKVGYEYRSSRSEYGMYAVSSHGSPGDTSHLVFPNVRPPAGHNLFFTYKLQENSGKLQLNLENRKGKHVVFEESSYSVSYQWLSACINMEDLMYNVTFSAIRGQKFGVYMALKEVGFKNEECQARSIACDFSNEKICQYYSYPGDYYRWQRVFDDQNNTQDFYMQASSQRYGTMKMLSPSQNIANSCVQVKYKINHFKEYCNLTIYDAVSNQTIVYNGDNSVSNQTIVYNGDNSSSWQTAQIFIKNKLTKLVFVVQNRGYSVCSASVESVQVKRGNCSELVCPSGSKSCQNRYCYSESKLCDGVNDCIDGSDEDNCPTSISCDFTSKFHCGYKILSGWYHDYNPYYSDSGSMGIWSSGTLRSPIQNITYSCVKLSVNVTDTTKGLFSVVLNHWKSSQGVSRSVISENSFLRTTTDKSYEEQFQIPAGLIYLEFKANLSGQLNLQDIMLTPGICPTLNCSGDKSPCSDNSRCIREKDKCNYYNDCQDGSDERNCPVYSTCDFEDDHLCGMKSNPAFSWSVDDGFKKLRPKLDKSEGTFEGHYIKSSVSGISRLLLPSKTLENTSCFDFFYIFYGQGSVSLYDNGTVLVSLSKFDVDTWRNVRITLSKGTHNLFYVYSNTNKTGNESLVAFDSISLKPGDCTHNDCPEDWLSCKDNYTCFPYTARCDGTPNCHNGEDELNCAGQNYTKYKLVGGYSVMSGAVFKYDSSYGYLPICTYRSLSTYYANQICSELDFNGTSSYQSVTAYIDSDYFYCYSGLNGCYRRSCRYGSCSCNLASITCSNTVCEDGKVVCPAAHNGTNSSSSVCIRRESLCDGHIDCQDGTDEENCDDCTDLQWQCINQKCIDKHKRCDGQEDCQDGSDEYNCFQYKESNGDVKVYYNGSFKDICEDQVVNSIPANQLCSYTGRSNGTYKDSQSGNGVKFVPDASNPDKPLIPGLKPSSYESCKVAKLNCSENQCGTRKLSLFEPSIRHGHNALEGEWPWAAQLYRSGRFMCSSTIIGRHYVLTAAHCIGSLYYSFEVRVGNTKLSEGQTYKVSRVSIHSNYGSYVKGYDIALLYVESGINMTDFVQPACLAKERPSLADECFVVGWGRTENNQLASVLQEIKVKLVNYADCKRHYPSMTDKVICANTKDIYQPICSGDSGGPLLCHNQQGKWTVAGVTSFGMRGCKLYTSAPAAFSDVIPALPWINRYL